MDRFIIRHVSRVVLALAVAAALLGAMAPGGSTAHAAKRSPEPSPVAGPIHYGDLDAAVSVARTAWSMKVTITVHDANDLPVRGVTVAGRWSGAVEGTVACVTGSRGTCTVASPKASLSATSMTFTTVSPTLGGTAYDASANHDPDGSSDGKSITVTR